MRVGFYDPYLSTLGGGEKYFLSLLEIAMQLWSEVVLLSPAEPDVRSWQRLRIQVAPDRIIWRPTDDSNMSPHSADLDLLVALHNYVPPLCRAKRSILILQFPFVAPAFPSVRHLRVDTLRRWRNERRRFSSYDVVVAYSRFVQDHIAQRTGLRSVVLSPPVDEPEDMKLAKESQILSVGRFFPGEANKKQHVLIDAFAALRDRQPVSHDWTLHLAGGVSATAAHDGAGFVSELRARAAGHPIQFWINPSAQELSSLYARSRLYWHATGFGESPTLHPERMEHFGITTVEAMSYGCVPLVFAAGGQREIVADGKSGLLWRSTEELVAGTSKLLADPITCDQMAAQARMAARPFEKAHFVQEGTALLRRMGTS
jgi:glycosyltransferase involved in cell wall biosynthesis